MFQFSGFASRITGLHSRLCRVAPFGNLRISGYLHLPTAYRSLSRPSSPLRAKASSVRPFLLSYCIGFIRFPQQYKPPVPPSKNRSSVFLNLFVSSSMSMNFTLLRAGSSAGNRTPLLLSFFILCLPPGRPLSVFFSLRSPAQS